MLTCTITTHYRNLRLSSASTQAENLSHLSHHSLSTYGAQQSVERARLDASVSKASTAGESATTTIGLWQHLGNLSHTWVFLYSKFLGNDKQYTGQHQCSRTQSNHCYQNCVHYY